MLILGIERKEYNLRSRRWGWKILLNRFRVQKFNVNEKIHPHKLTGDDVFEGPHPPLARLPHHRRRKFSVTRCWSKK